MSSEEKKSDRKEEMKTILKQIEKAPSDNIRELFRVSDISKDNFVYGIMEFHESEQQDLIDMMLKDLILEFLLQDSLRNWEKIPFTSRLDVLKNVYDILDFETKADYKSEHKIVKEILEEKIEQLKKIEAEREDAILAEIHKLKETLCKLNQAEIDATREVLDVGLKRCIKENNRFLIVTSVKQEETKQPAK